MIIDYFSKKAAAKAVTICGAAIFFFASYTAAYAGEPEVWFAPMDHVIRPEIGGGGAADYMDLFRPHAPWSKAASHIKVFKLYPQFFIQASDQDLQTVIANLRVRNIGLAIEYGMVTPGAGCGRGEGYDGTAPAIAARIKKLGGDLKYIFMDEPLWFGHYSSLPVAGYKACRSSVEEIAKNVANNIKAVRTIFPSVKVGDAEPIGNQEPSDWEQQISTWLAAYQKAVGEPLAFFSADIAWDGPWQNHLIDLTTRLHQAGIPVGFIYNSNPLPTGIEWVRHAEEHFVAIESMMGLLPDLVFIQTWNLQPDHVLPETTYGTMTNLVDRYFAQPSRLIVTSYQGAQMNLSGRLAGATNDLPITNANVEITALDNGNAQSFEETRNFKGSVPSGATYAVLGLRLDTECNCTAPAEVTLGTIHYHDMNSEQTTEYLFVSPQGDQHFIADENHAVLINSPAFPVTVGDHFEINVPMKTAPTSWVSGYVGIMFLDRHNKEIMRNEIEVRRGMKTIGSSFTDALGHFSFQVPVEVARRHPEYRIYFAGNTQYRTTWATLAK